MARPTSPTVTEAERAILEVLWNAGEASVREVTDTLSARKPVAYTTVLTMLGILLKKSLVEFRREGRAFIYRAAVSRDEVRAQALGNLLRQFFDDSPEVLALHLVQNHEIDDDDLDRLRAKVAAARSGSKR